MEKEIFALHVRLRNTLTPWAFDLFTEYTKAVALCKRAGLDHIQHHKCGVDGSANGLTLAARHHTDSDWIQLSEGINDAWELERAIRESEYV